MSYPTDRKYTKEHEWITPDGTMGITIYAQDSLGDIVFVELPKPGTELTKGKPLGTVESVKAVSDIYAPVSVKDPAEINTLLSAADYEKFVSEEAGH